MGDQAAIVAIADRFVDLYNKDEWHKLGDLYADDAWVLAPGQATSRGHSGAEESYKKTKASGLLKPKRGESHVEFLGADHAVGLIHWAFSKADGSVGGTLKDMTIFKKIGGKWQIYMQTFNTP